MPELANPKARPPLIQLFQDLQTLRKECLRQDYQILVKYTRCSALALYRMARKIASEATRHLLHVWSKDSPEMHLLYQRNILAPNERPAMTSRYRLRNNKITGDRLDFLVTHVYALTDRFNLQMAEAAEIGSKQFQAAFMPVPGSAFKTTATENDLAKIRIGSVIWDNLKLARPKEGESYVFSLPSQSQTARQHLTDTRRCQEVH